MDARDAENAAWWVVAAGAFLAWQAMTWLLARGRWQRARERGVALPVPRFMGETADYLASFLTDMVPVLFGLAQMAVGLAWLMFSMFGVAAPLWHRHGPAEGVLGGALVLVVGFAAGIAVLTSIGERHRAAQDRERAKLAAELRAIGGR